MNGQALCNSDTDCDQNTHMQGLIDYMNWITEEFHHNPQCGDFPADNCPPRGFPDLGESSVIGDATVGKAIFIQKCAFCHDAEGQGRYESERYFRPALWGDDSYHAISGMGKNPQTLAKFLRWNMPYTSGGLLTDQEAQDLACYIDSQVRPGKTQTGTTSAHCQPDSFAQ